MAQRGSTGRSDVAPRGPDTPTWLPGRRKAGRPSALQPNIEADFLMALRGGNTYADAARYVGLAPTTIEKWLRRGRGVDARPATPEYVRFARLAAQAKAAAKVLVVGNLVARSRLDTQAALAWLRHNDPEWRDDDPAPDEAPGRLGPGAVTNIDARHQEMQVLVLPPDAIPDFVHELLAQRREQQAGEVVEEQAPSIPIRVNSGARTRLSALRVDSTDPSAT